MSDLSSEPLLKKKRTFDIRIKNCLRALNKPIMEKIKWYYDSQVTLKESLTTYQCFTNNA